MVLRPDLTIGEPFRGCEALMRFEPPKARERQASGLPHRLSKARGDLQDRRRERLQHGLKTSPYPFTTETYVESGRSQIEDLRKTQGISTKAGCATFTACQQRGTLIKPALTHSNKPIPRRQ